MKGPTIVYRSVAPMSYFLKEI